MQPIEAALRGATEIGFTVVSISLSLVAVFIPILLMGGIVGRLFREFAVTLSVAIGVSLLVSLTTTPMMCATLLQAHGEEKHGRLYRAQRAGVRLDPRRLRAVASAGCCATSRLTLLGDPRRRWRRRVYLYVVIPKGFFPQQDTGRIDRRRSSPTRTPRSRRCRAARAVRGDRRCRTRRSTRQRLGRTAAAARTPAACSSRSRTVDERRLVGRPGHRAAAAAARARPRRHALPPAGAGHPGRRPRRATRSTSTRCEGTTSQELQDWAPRVLERPADAPAARRRQQRPADQGLEASLDDRPRHRVAPRHHARRRSTTRSTTPSASVRSRRCTRRSTSTT